MTLLPSFTLYGDRLEAVNPVGSSLNGRLTPCMTAVSHMAIT